MIDKRIVGWNREFKINPENKLISRRQADLKIEPERAGTVLRVVPGAGSGAAASINCLFHFFLESQRGTLVRYRFSAN